MHLTKLHYVALPPKVQRFKTPLIAAITATALSQFTLNFQWSTNSVIESSPLIQQCPIMARVAQEAEVTPEQESELNQICQDTRTQIELVLTPKQRETFQTNLAQGMSLRKAVYELKLSEQQWEQINRIRQSTRTRVELKLTYNQRQKIHKNHHLHR
ncbi:hypothetical protein H6G04_32430 [Calothrix membranacea FACHB-236]|nr:hypothetical protein [Calothrix membranacea FACHB-236]